MERGPWQGRRTRLRGRAEECAALDRLLADIRAGRGRSLVLRGEAGIGKTALLEYLLGTASDLTVLRGVGVESEMELPYASLHQVCSPVFDRVERLPAPQRQALEIVFGLSAGAPPDRFIVGLGVLSLLSEVAEERPLLCVIDDAQWLDRASALTLAFVARRMLAEPMGIVFAAREAGDELQQIEELEVVGLQNGDARELLGTTVQFILDEHVRDRIIAETRGNPLALLELPRGLTASELAAGFGVLGIHALPGRIEESFRRRLDALPPETRSLLLVAAAEPVGDPVLLWQAAKRLGIAPEAAEDAEAVELLAIAPRVTFRHPLVRSAVYRTAPADSRRAAHLALAEATDREHDPDRRAWHLAAATAEPDEDVALELEQSAGRAQARGGLAAAAALLQRSVSLTKDPARRVDRALAAAEASLRAGAFDTTHGLLAAAEAAELDGLQRARLDLLRAETAFSQSRGRDAPPLLLRAAKTLEPLDAKLARETYLDAWSAALFAGELADAGSLEEVSREARGAPRAPDPPRPSDLLLDGFSLLFTGDRSEALPILERAVAGFAGGAAAVDELLRWGWIVPVAGVAVWDYDRTLAVAARCVQVAREAGALTVLAVSLNILTQAVTMGGDFARAAQLISEADAVTEATGTPVAPYGAIFLGAFRGREAELSALIDATFDLANAAGQGTYVQFTHWGRAVVLNGLGRYSEAVAPAREASEETPKLVTAAWAETELVEAAVRTGELELAEATLRRLAARNVKETNWGGGIEARCRALLSAGDAAEGLYLEAIERLGRTRLRPELARAHLLYGEWLRAEGRSEDARPQLRAAYDQLTSIGMEAFAERARNELIDAGERVHKEAVETTDDLTAQERQIAQLARDGFSNHEIGARLFLSHRTVEWHLRKVFGKLGIHSRRELAGAL